MRKIITLLTLTSLFTMNSFACNEDGTEGFLPENDLYISADAKSLTNSNIDEKTFNEVIDKVEEIYSPIIDQMGAKLEVIRKWDDGTVNAYAQQSGKTWKVSMFGGLARHKEITPDGFALVVCHEIGHHIGGAPKKASIWSSSWASNEGQADYFATLKCLRKVFAKEPKRDILTRTDIPSRVKIDCYLQFNNDDERSICARGSMAGMSTARLFQDLRGNETDVKFSTPNETVVRKTDHNHPETQCRLDTYFNGALCSMSDTIDVSQKDETKGVCYRKAGDEKGVRPLCWFKPSES